MKPNKSIVYLKNIENIVSILNSEDYLEVESKLERLNKLCNKRLKDLQTNQKTIKKEIESDK